MISVGLAACTALAGALLLVGLAFLSLLSPSIVHSDPRPAARSELSYTCISSSSSSSREDGDDYSTPPKSSSSSSSRRGELPSIRDPASLELSVVVPAYNEEARLPSMLRDALEYLLDNYAPDQFEFIIVDDGSRDGTIRVALDLAREQQQRRRLPDDCIRIVKLVKNRGKGGAVRHGMLHARGKRILFVDADGASTFSDLKLLQGAMDEVLDDQRQQEQKKQSEKAQVNNGITSSDGEGRAIVVGSRAHMVTSPAVVKRSLLRNALMRSFHVYLGLLGISHIKDTQCGFKLFTRSAARAIFPSLHVEGWIFDIEILLIAGMLGDVGIKEVPITWNEVSGSKMDLVLDSLRMATDLLVIRASYTLGRWKVKR